MRQRILGLVGGALAAALAFAPAEAAAQCLAGYTLLPYAATSGCYRFTTAFTDWASAQAEAVSLGGHLAAIGSAAENAAVYDFAVSQNRSTFFIGFTDAAIEGTWVWVNGEPVVYTNWRAGEPNNVGEEDFGRVEGSVWNDVPANFSDFGIVEQSLSAVPEPATVGLLGLGLVGVAGAARRARRR